MVMGMEERTVTPVAGTGCGPVAHVARIRVDRAVSLIVRHSAVINFLALQGLALRPGGGAIPCARASAQLTRPFRLSSHAAFASGTRTANVAAARRAAPSPIRSTQLSCILLLNPLQGVVWLPKRPQPSACSLDKASLDLFACVSSKPAPSLPDIREDPIDGIMLGARKRSAASGVPAAALAVGAKDVVMLLQIIEPWKAAGIGVLVVFIFQHFIERDYVANEHLTDEDVRKWSLRSLSRFQTREEQHEISLRQ